MSIRGVPRIASRKGECLGAASARFYTRWMHGDAEAGREIKSASLDPLNPQSKYAEILLDVFRDVVKNDPAYVARLARHYLMFKSAPGHQPRQASVATPLATGPVGQATPRASARAARDNRSISRREFERLNDLMQEGYDLLKARQTTAACDVWLRAWEKCCALYEQGGFASLPAFDDRFRGMQCVSNWVQDLEQNNSAKCSLVRPASRMRSRRVPLARSRRLGTVRRRPDG